MSDTKTEADHLEALQKRLVGKTKEEQKTLIMDYLKDQGIQPEVKATLTDEQVRMIVSGSTEAVKEAAKQAAADVEQRFKVSPNEAKSIAEDEIGKTMREQKHRANDFRMAAEVIRAVARAATGRAKHGELQEAYEKEAEYLKGTGRDVRAMSIGTDTTGGYTGGEIWSNMLYDNVSRYSYARRYATVLPMEREILRIPKLTTSLTAEQTSEAGSITVSQPVYAQFTLNTKKLNVLTKPFSAELLEVAEPALVQSLINFATIEIAKAEDGLVFGTSAPGLLSHTTNNVTLDTGNTSIDNVDFDDLADLVYELEPHYIGFGEDVRGSGMFASGVSYFWVPHKLINVLTKITGSLNQYIWADVRELKHEQKIHGYGVKVCPGMSNSPSTATRLAAFGDLGYMVCGVKPGFRIELQSQGSVDSVNLNETNSYAIRVTEFFDNDSIDDEAFSVLKTASS